MKHKIPFRTRKAIIRAWNPDLHWTNSTGGRFQRRVILSKNGLAKRDS
ncbi:hypothetical protein [Methanosarcina sp. KYL-1]|nr:hypothetical protein [Methanosarcina sp. KYL-1]